MQRIWPSKSLKTLYIRPCLKALEYGERLEIMADKKLMQWVKRLRKRDDLCCLWLGEI